MVGDTKICSMCGDAKTLTEFSRASRDGDRLQSRCKPCSSSEFKKYRERNLQKFREYKHAARPENIQSRDAARAARALQAPEKAFERKRRAHLRSTFGLTTEDYELLLAKQNGTCAICGTTEPGRGSPYFHIDHSHDTGKVRGLLCNRCNIGLGYFKDCTEKLESAVQYLKER